MNSFMTIIILFVILAVFSTIWINLIRRFNLFSKCKHSELLKGLPLIVLILLFMGFIPTVKSDNGYSTVSAYNSSYTSYSAKISGRNINFVAPKSGVMKNKDSVTIKEKGWNAIIKINDIGKPERNGMNYRTLYSYDKFLPKYTSYKKYTVYYQDFCIEIKINFETPFVSLQKNDIESLEYSLKKA